jgi:wyosine [tRNA(Phe)-imidazoG37] synthetase (radical SAM superfamily)
MKYFSCISLEGLNMRFLINSNIKRLEMCCEPSGIAPGIAICETAEETVKSFVKERVNIITESIKFSLLGKYAVDEERVFTSRCAKCASFQLNNWMSDGLSHYIILSILPSPCQCKCIYCYYRTTDNAVPSERYLAENFGKAFEILEYAQKNDLIAKDAIWEISSGEITIHPYKDRILDFVKDRVAYFFTNCFIYDEKIAANLAANLQSAIKLSIDSGTRETWYKVKGVDNFSKVMDNLAKYSASSTRPEQITLKYIILLGINDNLEDYLSLIEIMKNLKIKCLEISCDLCTKSFDKKKREPLVQAAGNLAAMLYKNGMGIHMNPDCYFPDEIQRVEDIARKLLMASMKQITHIPLPQDISNILTGDLDSMDLVNGNFVLNCGVVDPQVYLPLQEPIVRPFGDPFIVIECTNSECGVIQVFYDFGNGLSEANSARLNIEEASEMTKILLPIVGWQPGINLYSIRVDPPNGARFAVKNVVIMENQA